MGDNCEIDVNECLNSFCLYGLVCINVNGFYLCICWLGWVGIYCEFDVNECDILDKCKNGVICLNIEGFFMCLCFIGWVGEIC